MGCETLQGKYAEKLEKRIDKAIEFIKNNIDNTGWLEIGSGDVKLLLEILEGKDGRE